MDINQIRHTYIQHKFYNQPSTRQYYETNHFSEASFLVFNIIASGITAYCSLVRSKRNLCRLSLCE